MDTQAQALFTAEDIIFTHTRQDLLSDGALVDVSDMAREAGFTWPVAITAKVMEVIENIPPSKSHQDTKGRLWDVLWTASRAAKRGGTNILYRLICHHGRRTYLTLKMVSRPHGPYDDCPCITIMMPWED